MDVVNTTSGKLFVLDTNILMNDPVSIFNFKENDVFIPMLVLEELDKGKKGLSDVSRNVRQVSRFFNELIKDIGRDDIGKGIPLSKVLNKGNNGKLFFQTNELKSELPKSMPGSLADNSILSVVLALSKKHPKIKVVLVSKDINMRIKAAALEINVEDYHKDSTIDDIDLLYTGSIELKNNFWEDCEIESWNEGGSVYYKIKGDLVKDWHINQFLYVADGTDFAAVVTSCDGKEAVYKLLTNYTNNNNVFGVNARNKEQNFLLNVLLDPEIDFITVLGSAGTGKSLLTIAAGLKMVLDDKMYSDIIMTRETVSIGEDIGFLPGMEEEKLAPWMGALFDNLEVLGGESGDDEWEKGASKSIIMNRVKIKALGFMRGRTFLSKYLILEEAQNLSPKQMKTLITRAGPGTKVICMGNLSQIDTHFLTETTSGLTYVVNKFKNFERGAHIILQQCERSILADFAEDVL